MHRANQVIAAALGMSERELEEKRVMSETTLVILAAGMGARYGKGIKQLEPVGPNGELIVDYSVHDAVQAGFERVIFILRQDIFDDFRAVIGDRLERRLAPMGIHPEYVFQETDSLPAGRKKPWGTGHVLLSCCSLLEDPSPSSTRMTTTESTPLSRRSAS